MTSRSDDLFEELRDALKVDPAPGFESSVLERLHKEPVRRGRGSGPSQGLRRAALVVTLLWTVPSDRQSAESESAPAVTTVARETVKEPAVMPSAPPRPRTEDQSVRRLPGAAGQPATSVLVARDQAVLVALWLDSMTKQTQALPPASVPFDPAGPIPLSPPIDIPALSVTVLASPEGANQEVN